MFDWKSFNNELPQNNDEWVIVCIVEFSTKGKLFIYDVTQVDTECKYNLLNFPFIVENGDGELLGWCYIDEPKSGFGKKKDNLITVTQARKLLGCSVSTIYKFIHQEDFPRMQKIDLKSYGFSKDEFIIWCKKHKIRKEFYE